MNRDGMRSTQVAGRGVRTACGREIAVGRLHLDGLPRPENRVTLDVGLQPYDHGEAWISLTADEARRLAADLLAEARSIDLDEQDAVEPAGAGPLVRERIEVTPVEGEAYAIRVGDHTIFVDQPVDAGGDDEAATPTEVFVASLASCVAFYAGRFLTRHGLSRQGMRVTADFDMAADRPARVGTVRIGLSVPGLPPGRRPALRAVVAQCAVHNSIRRAPEVTLDLL